MQKSRIFYDLYPDEGIFLVDSSGKKYIDFTSGSGNFPAGYLKEDLNLKASIEKISDLKLFSERLSRYTSGNYSFSFFNTKTEALEAINSLISGTIINCEKDLSSFLYNKIDFYQKTCSNCSEGPDELVCSQNCNFFLKDFIDHFFIDRKCAFLSSYFKTHENPGRLPLPIIDLLKNELIPWICYEQDQSIFRLGTLFSFSQSDRLPDIIFGGEGLCFGLPFFYVAINKSSFNNKQIFTIPSISSISIKLAKKTIDSIKKNDVKEKISLFSSELSKRFSGRYKFSSLGLAAKIKVKKEKIDDFYQKSINYGLLVKICPIENSVFLSPSLIAEKEQLIQGIAITGEILKDISR